MSELISHLRTVHFALIVVCTVMLVSLIGGSPTEIEKADQQLNKVMRIKSDWNRWLNRWGVEQAKGLEGVAPTWTGVPSGIAVCIPGSRDWSFGLLGSPLRFYLASGYLVHSQGWKLLADGVRRVDGLLEISSRTGNWPATLDEFRQFWNSGDTVGVQIVDSISPEVYFFTDGLNTTRYPWTAPCSARSFSLELEYRREDRICAKRVFPELEGRQMFCGDISNEPTTVAVPVNLQEFPVQTDLRVWLLKEYNLDVVGTDFAKDFPELNKITLHYQTLPMEKVKLVLASELQRGGERLQVVGLTLPVRILSIVGPIIICAIQLYMLLYILHFRSLPQIGSSEPIPWVALHDHWLARVTGAITVALLPFATTVLATFMHYVWLNLLMVIFSGFLAFESIRTLWRLHKYSKMTPHWPKVGD